MSNHVKSNLRNPPKVLNVFGTECRLNEKCIVHRWQNNVWENDQKDLLFLSITIYEQLSREAREQRNLFITLGWSIRVEWWNNYNDRTFVRSKQANTLKEAEEDVLDQLSKLVEGAKKVQTSLMFNVLNKEKQIF